MVKEETKQGLQVSKLTQPTTQDKEKHFLQHRTTNQKIMTI
jgi:hypothetical protein